MEIAALLWRGAQSHKVWQVLGKLEDLPLAYLHSSAIPRLELQEAVDAFIGGREIVTSSHSSIASTRRSISAEHRQPPS